MSLEKKFEKELAGGLRKETADRLREIRKRPATLKDLQEEKNMPPEYEAPHIRERIEEIKRNIFGKIFKTESFREKELLLMEILESAKKHDIKTAREDYQRKFNKILKNCPLTPEEREKYLSTEAMEKMNLDDYLILLKRLSGEAFYHVTRYGVRENTFFEHETGKSEFMDSFTPLLEDGRIKSCAATIISNREFARSVVDEETVREEKEKGKSAGEVVEKFMATYDTPYFLDRESTHFSYGRDLNRMYGGEDNYKFYFYYPAEYILQNDFYHSTRESQITIGQGYYRNRGGIEQRYNDFEIFNFGEGVPINAGILCITGDAQVDPETGSQYVIKNGKPVIDEKGEFKKPEKTISSRQYWENYFETHPDLKPSKIIYGGLYTESIDANPDLENWARSKEIHQQDEDKKQEFLDYQKKIRQALREILTNVVKEMYREFDSNA
ncbi:MAG: hypothetical protein PHQ42_00685 [Patescibacteria group bacterium]|nr:hypothetical protein [Patescibacteria group bacterium]